MSQKIIDLTLLMEDNMPAHRSFQSPILSLHRSHEHTIHEGLGTPEDPYSYQTNVLCMLDHVGTHMDAPIHYGPNGTSIDNVPLAMCMGKAVCFDFTHVPDLGEIDAEDMNLAEQKAGVKVNGHIVLMNTGIHKRYYPNKEMCFKHPGLTAAATHWLADRGSKLHGVEGPSTDRPIDNTYPSHRVCRDRDLAHVEWLVNLEELVGKGEFMFYAAPLKIKSGSGSPLRAFAILDA